VTTSSSTSLEQDITLEELKHNVWDYEGSKSPSSNGFNFKFYKLTWDFITDDLLDLAKNFFQNR